MNSEAEMASMITCVFLQQPDEAAIITGFTLLQQFKNNRGDSVPELLDEIQE